MAAAPPAYAPASDVDLAARAVEAESRPLTILGRWIDDHPIAYPAIVAVAVHGGIEAAGALAKGLTARENSSDWDITLPEFLEGRAAYEKEVGNIGEEAQRMLAEGYSPEDVANWAYNRRREIGVEYKNLTPPDLRERMYQRNIEKYGDPLGPSVDYFRERGYTDQDIIDSASRPGGEDLIPRIIDELRARWR